MLGLLAAVTNWMAEVSFSEGLTLSAVRESCLLGDIIGDFRGETAGEVAGGEDGGERVSGEIGGEIEGGELARFNADALIAKM